MRRAAKVDANQGDVVRALRQVPGVSVESLAAVGDGVTDLLIGFRGLNWLFELKDPRKPPSARRLTPAQEKWHAAWRGQRAVVETAEQILVAIGAVKAKHPADCDDVTCCPMGRSG